MYATCLFCHGPLGRNAVVEALPVGRCLAFDPARGRLWVVCGRCARWNLTPFEERWEALEQCERAFRGTRLRVSTDNVGLARVADGLELVRIGEALRPELAAWRYGEQFARRRRRQLALGSVAAVSTVAFLFGGPAVGLATGGAFQGVNVLLQLANQYRDRRRVVARVPVDSPEGRRLLPVAPVHARRSRLRAVGIGRWELELEYRGPGERLRMTLDRGLVHVAPSVTLAGAEALRAAGRLLPHVNVGGGTRRDVSDAVRVVEEAGAVERCFALAARDPDAGRRARWSGWHPAGEAASVPGALASFPAAIRLALEMAAHEDSERRALQGELMELEAAWREAEEIAAIADDLLVPASAAERLASLRSAVPPDPGSPPAPG